MHDHKTSHINARRGRPRVRLRSLSDAWHLESIKSCRMYSPCFVKKAPFELMKIGRFERRRLFVRIIDGRSGERELLLTASNLLLSNVTVFQTHLLSHIDAASQRASVFRLPGRRYWEHRSASKASIRQWHLSARWERLRMSVARTLVEACFQERHRDRA